jgi:hypothetical protein
MSVKRGSVCGVTFACCTFFAGAVHAQGDLDAQRQKLALIADTADRICGKISVDGENSSNEIQGNVHAELKGLATKLANAGISGNGKIAESKYTNIVQAELAGAIRNSSECKERIFNGLKGMLSSTDGGPVNTQKAEVINGPMVNFGCGGGNSSLAGYTAPPGLRILNVVLSIDDISNVKSSSAHIISNDGTTVNAAADLRGLDKDWTGNCRGGGHGRLRMVVTTVGR